jgi:choline-sulfatase
LIETPVSTIDHLPNAAATSPASRMAEVMPWTDGESLVATWMVARAKALSRWNTPPRFEISPFVALREGRWKYTNCERSIPSSCSISTTDPRRDAEPRRGPGPRRHAGTFPRHGRRPLGHELPSTPRSVDSQARRHAVYAALRNGAYYPWDFQPLRAASERYMRNHMDLNVLEESSALSAGRMTMTCNRKPAIS